MAGQLKRDNPDLREDVVLIRALRDSNLPKFLADDAVLFQVRLQCGCRCSSGTCVWWVGHMPQTHLCSPG